MNTGKRFEQNWKQSIPDYVFMHRLPDSTGTFSGGSNLRFSSKQPCDYFLFDDHAKMLYALELKSTKAKSMSFEWGDEKKSSAMIHKHQIESLLKMNKYEHMICGFVFNFRELGLTYFQFIDDFLCMIENINKVSFNNQDILKYNPILIKERKLKVNSRYDVCKFLQMSQSLIEKGD